MRRHVAPVAVAWALFAVAVATSGAGWFDDDRAETLARAVLLAALLTAAAVVAAGLWVIGGLRVPAGMVIAAGLLLAAPVDVVAPGPGFSTTHISVVPVLDVVLVVVGVVASPAFAYHEATVFPGGDGWVLPASSPLAPVLAAAILLGLAIIRRAGARERLVRLIFIGAGRN